MPATVERARRTALTRPTIGQSVVLALAAVATLALIALVAHRYGFADLALHRAALQSWLDGDGLYAYRSPESHLGTALTPAAALLLTPIAFLPNGLAGWLIALGGVTALVLALIALVGPVARRYGRRRWPVVLVATMLALGVEPVRTTLGLGGFDLVLFGLIAADVVALRRRAWARSRAAWWPGRSASASTRDHLLRRGWATGAWAGVGVGIATAFAISPGLFIGYLALTRQWRATFTALATAATLAAGALMVAPQETARWFDEVLWRLDRTGPVGDAANQSLAGMLARLYHSATIPVLLWLSFALLLVAVGLIRARSAHADGDEIAAFTLVGLTTAIIGPVTPTHELAWVLPAVLILADAAARRRTERRRRPLPGLRHRYPGVGYLTAAVLGYVLFVVTPLRTLTEEGGATGLIGGNAYALALIVLVTALPWRPGVAPAFVINRWAAPARRPIPPARRPS
jgi:alpha-1,2-mannosyltransferase